MVEHIVEIHFNALFVGFLAEYLHIVVNAERGVDGSVVGHVVAVIRPAGVYWREPDGACAQGIDIVQMLGDARDVAIVVAKGGICK